MASILNRQFTPWCPNSKGGTVPVLLWITLLITLLLSLLADAQLTQPTSSCTFLDDQNVFNIEVLKGTHSLPCPTLEGLAEQVKDADATLSEIAYEVMQLQTQTLKLMDTNLNLTLLLQKVDAALEATQNALQAIDDVAIECPVGFDVHNEALKSCYMFGTRQLTWYNAETFCLGSRGHLTAITSQEEQDFIVSRIQSSTELPGHHFWTGGNDVATEDTWMWAGDNIEFDYQSWMAYPDNLNDAEHCVHLFHLHNYDWNDANCLNSYYFICEYKLA